MTMTTMKAMTLDGEAATAASGMSRCRSRLPLAEVFATDRASRAEDLRVFTSLPLLSGAGRAHHGEILAHAARLAEAGKLAPRIDPRRFGLTAAGAALRARLW